MIIVIITIILIIIAINIFVIIFIIIIIFINYNTIILIILIYNNIIIIIIIIIVLIEAGRLSFFYVPCALAIRDLNVICVLVRWLLWEREDPCKKVLGTIFLKNQIVPV